jgi:hypothetical protein
MRAPIYALLIGLAVGAAEEGSTEAANTEWLAENAKASDVITLPSGLQYKILGSGAKSGKMPRIADKCTCHYEGVRMRSSEKMHACSMTTPCTASQGR